MKKLIVSTIAAATLTTSAVASEECPTLEERIAFGTIGTIQGAVIGGPVGAFWAYGMIWWANKHACEEMTVTTVKKEKNAVVKEPEIKVVKTIDNKLDNIIVKSKVKVAKQVVKKPEPKKTIKPIIVRYDSVVNFAFDSYKISTVPTKLNSIDYSKVKSIQLDGHTDSKGTDEYNFALGLKRANALKQVIVDVKNIDQSKIKTTSYGESSPISNNDSKNRRVDMIVNY